MPHNQPKEPLAPDSKRDSNEDEKSHHESEEKTQPWKAIIPFIEAKSERDVDPREMFTCDQGLYDQSLAG